jgi:glycosyltransferase involved in cell wall biosynthesis
VKLKSIIRRPPRDLIAAARRRLFLYKERNLRFRRFSRGQRQGVNLAGYIRAEMGLGQAARGVAKALESVQLPFNILNFEAGNRGRHGDMSWVHKEVTSSHYDVTILVINPDNIFNARKQLPKEIFGNRYVIGYWFWELPTVPDEWVPAFSLVNEVWAASRFVQRNISQRSPVPVVRIPPVVEVKDGQAFSRQYFNLPERRFLFLTICDTGSVFERKNPTGAIAAFKKAFSPDDQSVGLVIKISGPAHRPPNLQLIAEQIQGYANIWLVDRLLTPEELSSLQNVTDCGVSLHRAEGFGLVPAEMMSLGKPVIATRWSGNTDYMTADNSIGIDYQLVRLGQDYGPYEGSQSWAEPDIEQAAYWMKKLYEDKDLARRIGTLGQQTMNDNFSPQAVGQIIGERLSHVRIQRS